MRQRIWGVLEMLKGQGQAILVIDKGGTAWQGDAAALLAADSPAHRYLSV